LWASAPSVGCQLSVPCSGFHIPFPVVQDRKRGTKRGTENKMRNRERGTDNRERLWDTPQTLDAPLASCAYGRLPCDPERVPFRHRTHLAASPTTLSVMGPFDSPSTPPRLPLDSLRSLGVARGRSGSLRVARDGSPQPSRLTGAPQGGERTPPSPSESGSGGQAHQ